MSPMAIDGRGDRAIRTMEHTATGRMLLQGEKVSTVISPKNWLYADIQHNKS
jgi:hypothetical protein